MYIVTITNKATREETILTAFENENKALKMCESWGWTYADGKAAYFMAYEELNNGVYDLLEDATPSRFQTVEDAVDVVQVAYKSGLITLGQRNTLLRA